MTTQEYKNKLERVHKKNKQIQMKEKLEEAKYKKKRKISTSKLVLWSVVALNIEILIFVEVMMAMYKDFSAMYALISIPVSLVPTILGYFWKSKAENTGADGTGIVFQQMMNEHDSEG